MAIKKVRAKSGVEYDVNSPQGKTIVASATQGSDADFDSNQTPPQSALGSGSILETLQALRFETEDQGDTLEEISGAIEGSGPSDSEKRKDKITQSNKKKNRFGSALEGFGKGMKSVGKGIGTGFGKVKNSIMDNLGMLTIGAGLVALERYEEELVGPDGYLTKFLEYLKVSLIPDIKKLYQETIIWWDEAWEGVEKFFGWMKKKFTQIKDYVASFDADKDGSLDDDEMAALKKDVSDVAVGYIKDFFITLISAVGLLILGKSFIGTAAGLARTAILASPLFATAATAATGAAVIPAAGAAAVGVGGVIGIGIMIAAMVGSIITASIRGFDAAEMPDGAGVNWSRFFASYVAGGAEGGTGNAIRNSFEKSMTGAGIGAGAGFLVGGPLGALVGGMLGILTGGLIGWFTGKKGADAYEPIYDDIGTSFMDSKNKFFRYFQDLFTGMSGVIPKDELNRDIAKAQDLVDKASFAGQVDQYVTDLTVGSTKPEGDAARSYMNILKSTPVPAQYADDPERYRLGMFIHAAQSGQFGVSMQNRSLSPELNAAQKALGMQQVGGTVSEIIARLEGKAVTETADAQKELNELINYRFDRPALLNNQSLAKIQETYDESEEQRKLLLANPQEYFIRKFANNPERLADFMKSPLFGDNAAMMDSKLFMREEAVLTTRGVALQRMINKKSTQRIQGVDYVNDFGTGTMTNTELDIKIDKFIKKHNLNPDYTVGGETYTAKRVAAERIRLIQQDSNNQTHISYNPSDISVHNQDLLTKMLNNVTYLGN